MTKRTIPVGRSDYRPGYGRVGEPSPQSDPDAFSSEDVLAEVKYLLAANRRHGSNPLRTIAYSKLLRVLRDRNYTGSEVTR